MRSIMKKTATQVSLAVVTFCLCTAAGSVSASIIEIDENLDNGLVPTGFSLSTTNSAGLANGRLEANAVNGSAALSYNNLPAGLSRIDISFSGDFGYSYWGTYTEVTLGGLPISMSHGVNDFKFDTNDFASLSGAPTAINTLSRTPSFDYHISLTNGQVRYSGYDSATNTEAFNLVHTDASILLAAINQISLRAHNTTGSETVWLDDINIKLHVSAVPVPAAVWLFGSALLGLIGFGKRRKAA